MSARRLAMGIAGAAGAIAGITLLARVAGLGRVLVFADSVRAGGVGEIYQSVNALPNVMVEIAAGGALAAVAVPLIARHRGLGDEAAAHRLASTLLTWVLTLLVPVAVALALAAEPLASFLVTDFDPRAQEVSARMLRIFAVQIPFYGMGIVLTGLLHAHRRFVAAALAPLLSSVVVLVSYLWYGSMVKGAIAPSAVSSTAIDVLAWGTTAGVVALSLPLVGPALATGWRWSPQWRLSGPERAAVGRLATAGLVVVIAQQLATLAVLWLANHAGDRGVLPVWQYAQTVYLLPYAVLAVPIAMSTFPTLALTAESAEGPASATLARALRGVLVVAGLGAAALIGGARPTGAFFALLDRRRGPQGASTAALEALPGTLLALAPGLIGFSVLALLTRALFVRGPAVAGAAAVAAGWAISALPLLTTGPDAGAETTLRQLALTSTLGMSLAAAGLALLVRRSWGEPATAGAARTLGALVIGVAAALALSDAVLAGWPLDTLAQSVGGGVLGGSVAALAFLGVMAVGDRELLGELRRRGRARREGAL